ncbi:MAG TPA: glutamate-1-semialdehyde 2,1-aminomutase [Actinomycetota bacterium]|nr:glutamate-1-semialdehyde 2,1-aminomutase [Actinomycetota bacterium]
MTYPSTPAHAGVAGSRAIFERARELLPGGVSSPARAFAAVEGDPVVAASGTGSRLTDADGREYLDYIQGFGSIILGHGDPLATSAVQKAAGRGAVFGLTTADEVKLAEMIVEAIASVERVRFLASGTEAGMTAARIARGATGRPVIVKFEGCYHGHADEFLASAGSGVATFSIPGTSGVPASSVSSTIVLPYNDPASLRSAFEVHGQDIAAVFVEPVAANMGVVIPQADFLLAISQLCAQHGALCVFDEVVTGFRIGRSGAQGAFGLQPDLTMFGKVVGGGLPVGVVGGRAELMDLLSPVGPVYQGGTYAAHPHAMASGTAVLEVLTEGLYADLERTAAALEEGLAEAAASAGAQACVVRAATMLSVFFTPSPPRDFAEVQAGDRKSFARFHASLREQGVLIAPSPYEAWFPSASHSSADVEATVAAAAIAFSSSSA